MSQHCHLLVYPGTELSSEICTDKGDKEIQKHL